MQILRTLVLMSALLVVGVTVEWRVVVLVVAIGLSLSVSRLLTDGPQSHGLALLLLVLWSLSINSFGALAVCFGAALGLGSTLLHKMRGSKITAPIGKEIWASGIVVAILFARVVEQQRHLTWLMNGGDSANFMVVARTLRLRPLGEMLSNILAIATPSLMSALANPFPDQVPSIDSLARSAFAITVVIFFWTLHAARDASQTRRRIENKISLIVTTLALVIVIGGLGFGFAQLNGYLSHGMSVFSAVVILTSIAGNITFRQLVMRTIVLAVLSLLVWPPLVFLTLGLSLSLAVSTYCESVRWANKKLTRERVRRLSGRALPLALFICISCVAVFAGIAARLLFAYPPNGAAIPGTFLLVVLMVIVLTHASSEASYSERLWAALLLAFVSLALSHPHSDSLEPMLALWWTYMTVDNDFIRGGVTTAYYMAKLSVTILVALVVMWWAKLPEFRHLETQGLVALSVVLFSSVSLVNMSYLNMFRTNQTVLVVSDAYRDALSQDFTVSPRIYWDFATGWHDMNLNRFSGIEFEEYFGSPVGYEDRSWRNSSGPLGDVRWPTSLRPDSDLCVAFGLMEAVGITHTTIVTRDPSMPERVRRACYTPNLFVNVDVRSARLHNRG